MVGQAESSVGATTSIFTLTSHHNRSWPGEATNQSSWPKVKVASFTTLQAVAMSAPKASTTPRRATVMDTSKPLFTTSQTRYRTPSTSRVILVRSKAAPSLEPTSRRSASSPSSHDSHISLNSRSSHINQPTRPRPRAIMHLVRTRAVMLIHTCPQALNPAMVSLSKGHQCTMVKTSRLRRPGR